ncbi:hypothetical protein [Natranaeroarchaeum sulfidigenes]|uniref:Archaeal/vacuolar-type H+-ATPase subunit K n=1 Tax=Natranaeroarchaeum sulfidigenes TaxID=2784880 RepID=A0A897MU16_9EURY|nr:Archaeal/vacuolar-type H+-ATPase subunit K [Natranaeroarchaeum sulfidigenes]
METELLTTLAESATILEAMSPEAAEALATGYAQVAAAIAVAVSALAAGYAERGIGSAAIGAISEDEDLFGKSLVITVLPETLVIFALVVFILTL